MRLITLSILLLLASAPTKVAAQATSAPGAPTVWSAQPLRPGDIIRLRVWREPDMAGDYPINEEGMAVLPRLGRTQVAGESPRQLEARLVKAYERFLQQPAVEVTLLRKVQVLGAVRTPGLHPVDATMTVSDVLALAGGTTAQGDPERIELIRGGERTQIHLRGDTRLADSTIQSGDQIYVPERSWLSRNSGILAAGITSLFIGFFTRR